MTTIANIADAVVTALNGAPEGAFSLPFTAARAYLPVFDLKEMKDLHVTVVPKGVELAAAGRGTIQRDVQIDVAVQQKLSACDDSEIDALMELVQEIGEFIRSAGRIGGAAWVRTENVPIYSQEHLGELRQFTSVLTVTLRTVSA
jgi:hypothetical protein